MYQNIPKNICASEYIIKNECRYSKSNLFNCLKIKLIKNILFYSLEIT